ncbi:uncharacterized protein LOC117219216 isoform X2 [Megalopta genalis]|uniref:uncharacterized protein LOC117219216 isoform X2 n=1 Tax=Megalopta genalis TaxID=115081 RepID=UPI003FD582FC
MKYWNKKIEKRKNSKSGKRIKKPEKYQFVKNSKNHNTYGRFYVAPTDYVFYSIINTDLQMIRRTETALIIRSLIELYMILENDTGKSHYLETWFQNGGIPRIRTCSRLVNKLKCCNRGIERGTSPTAIHLRRHDAM